MRGAVGFLMVKLQAKHVQGVSERGTSEVPVPTNPEWCEQSGRNIGSI